MSYSSWAEAYFAQAKQDFALASLYSPDTGDKLTAARCMLLQMFFEKYAKAIYCISNKTLPQRNHKTFNIFHQTLRKTPKYLEACFPFFYKFLEDLERFQPSNANKWGHKLGDLHPQLEYPWYDNGTGKYCSPCSDLPLINNCENPEECYYFPRVFPIVNALINDFSFYSKKRCFPGK